MVALVGFHSRAAIAESVAVGAGHSGYWYNLERSGAGLALEVLPGEVVALYWFTYDDAGRPRWLLGVGHIKHDPDGAYIEFPQLVAPHGGHFGQPFDLGPDNKPVVGEARLRFADCDRGTFSYNAFDLSGSIPIQRLTHTMGTASCWPYNGVPGMPVEPYAGQSGSWYDPARSGAGLSLQWLAQGLAVVTWYTFDTQGHPYWIQGVGHLAGDQIVFPTLYTATGGRFAQAFDRDQLHSQAWGSLTLSLDCNGGTAHYQSSMPGFGSGNLSLTHLTSLARPACPYKKPAFTDLYSITWTEIPIPAGNPQAPWNIQAQAIANDGTVAASGAFSWDAYPFRLALWHPGASQWQILDRVIYMDQVFISPDGDSVYTSGPTSAENPGPVSVPLLWEEGKGWTLLPGLVLDSSRIYAVSKNFSHAVGRALDPLNAPGHTAWIWDRSAGQSPLPHSNDSAGVYGAHPSAVSDNGEIVVGPGVWYSGDPPSTHDVAVIWHGREGPEILRDDKGTPLVYPTDCNRDCSLIFGIGQLKVQPDQPHWLNSWIWIKGDETVYVGAPNDALDTGHSAPIEVTASGDLVVGVYDLKFGVYEYDFAVPRVGFYIWTQRTGIVSVDALVEQLGIGDHAWGMTNPPRVSLNGKYILLSGWFPYTTAGAPDRNRAVVLELAPKGGVPGEP